MRASADDSGAPSGPSLPVRYYPRRVRGRRGGRGADPLTPSQALHLASDPARAALAARTAERRQLVVTPAAAAAPAAGPAPGRLRGWFIRLVGRRRRDR